MTPFGKRVREHRMARGITLKQMAADLGVSSWVLAAVGVATALLFAFAIGEPETVQA